MPSRAVPFAINTDAYTLSHTVRDGLGHLADQGYASFELMMYPGHRWPAAAGGRMAALERDGDPRMAVIYDVANASFIGEDLNDRLRRVRPRLELVHLSDTPRDVYEHSPVGESSVPFAELPAILDEVGHREVPVLEIISDDPDRTIEESCQRLFDMGWPDRAARP